MNLKFSKLIGAIECMERQFEMYNPDDVESVSMLNIAINSNESDIQVGKEADHNKEYIAIFESLEKRIKAVKAKVIL